MIYGWDGASYQGLPDVALLQREGNLFCFEKCTGEGNYVNPFWRTVRDACREVGVVFGSYDWVEPQRWAGPWDAQEAARDFLRTVGEVRPGELILVDFETPDWATGPYKQFIEAPMQTYLYTLLAESLQQVVVYTAPYFLEETGASGWDWLGRDFILWQAAPGKDAMLPDNAPWPGTPRPWKVTTIHQHQWHATSAGVVGEFDRNRFEGTAEDLRMLGGEGTLNKESEETGEVQEPPEGKYTVYINARGNPIFVWNVGGQTSRIDGINVRDLGVSVESATEPGVILDRSIQDQEVRPYHDRRQP